MIIFTACETDEPLILQEDDMTVMEESMAPADFQKLLNLVNDTRVTGCRCGTEDMPAVGQVRWNSLLAAAAEQHSKDMADNEHFNHTGTDGSSAGDRIQQQGYNWQTYGENIALGYNSATKVFQAWLDSPGHCKNMMNANFEEMGAAVVNQYWTQNFARSF